MKRMSLVTASAAFAAALASPIALSQQSSTDTSASSPQTPSITSQSPGSSTMSESRPASSDSAMPGAHSGSTLQRQHSEATIRRVQQALKDKGVYDGEIDGIMGPKTEQALQQFQSREGLASAHGLDTQTLAALHVDASAADLSSGPASGSGMSSGSTSGSPSSSASGSSSGSSSADRSSGSAAGSSIATPPSSAPRTSADDTKSTK